MITRLLRSAVAAVSDVRSRINKRIQQERDLWHRWWYGLRGVGDLIATVTHFTRQPWNVKPSAKGDRRFTIEGLVAWFVIDVLGWPTCGCPYRQDRLNAAWPIHPPKLAIVFTHRDDRRAIWHVLQWFADEIRSTRMTRAWCSIVVVDQSPLQPTDVAVDVQEFHLGNKPWRQGETQRYVPNDYLEVTFHDGRKQGVAGPVWLFQEGVRKYYRRSQLADLCVELRGRVDIRYAPQEPLGTAPARRLGVQIAARHCRAKWVLMADCHVTCERGRVPQIMRHIRPAAIRDSERLYHGLLVNLQGDVIATHLKIWNDDGTPRVGADAIWGQWDTDPQLAKLKGQAKSAPIASGGGWIMLGHINRLRDLWHPEQRGFLAPETFTSYRHSHTAFNSPPKNHAGEVHVLGLLDFPHCFIRDSNPAYGNHRPQDDCWSYALECFALAANLQPYAHRAGFANAWEMFRAHWITRLPAEEVDAIAADARRVHEAHVARQLAGHARNRGKAVGVRDQGLANAITETAPLAPREGRGAGGEGRTQNPPSMIHATPAEPSDLTTMAITTSSMDASSVLPAGTDVTTDAAAASSDSTPSAASPNPQPLPPIAAICATYGRPDCVRSLLAMWGQQTYPGKLCLVIVDSGKSFPTISGDVNGRPFRVISLPERVTAGAAHNVALKDAIAHGFESFVIMDDDDVYLPNYVASHAATLAAGADWSLPANGFAVWGENPTDIRVEDTNRLVWHAAWGFSKRLLDQAGWYQDTFEGFDLAQLQRLQELGTKPVDPWPDGNSQHVYRWQVVSQNSSAGDLQGRSPDYTADRPYREPLTPQLDANAATLIALLTSGDQAKAA